MLSSSQQIKYGVTISYLTMGVLILSGLLYTPWMIDIIGQGGFGLYVLALSIINLFLFDFGLSAAVTRFIAKYNAEGNTEKSKAFITLIAKLYLCIDFVLFIGFVILFCFIPEIYKELSPEEIHQFKIVFSIVALSSLFLIVALPLNGILNAHEKFLQLKTCDLIQRLLTTGAIILALCLGGGLYPLVLINAIGGVLFVFIKAAIIYKETPLRLSFKHKASQSELKEVGTFSLWVSVVSISQRFIFNIAPSILGYLSGSTAIAIFGVAMTLEAYTYTFANVLNGMFIPRVSKIMSKGDNTSEIQLLMIRVSRIQLLVIGAIVLGFAFFGREFIRLWLGADFDAAYYCTLLVIIPSFFHLPQEIAATTIMVTNKVYLEARVYMLMAVVNIVLMFFFVPKYGAVGASAAICVAYLARTFFMNIVYHRVLHINLAVFFRKTFFPYSKPGVIGFIAGSITWFFPIGDGWGDLLYKMMFFVGCYSLATYYLYINNEEKQLIIKPIIKFISKSQTE